MQLYMKMFLFIILSLNCFQYDDFKLQTGDLIFQESCTGNMGSAIKEVTTSAEEYQFTHVGMVYIDENDSVFVIEATRPKVTKTPLREYLYPENEKECPPVSVVGRLKPEYRHCVPKAIEEGLSLIGKEYDNGFVLGDDTYYCSELVYEILLKANDGKPVFPLNIMTFKSPESGEISAGWIEHFKKYNKPVPEGEPGINPGAMSRSDVIEIVHRY
ncbi:peptidoglycan peptidase [Bacteroidia bacterium]|nr:peptidoglycan peptidase [Bacteroidia bacterium]